MPERRSANTVYVQFFWSAINSIKKPTLEKIFKAVVKNIKGITLTECEDELRQADAEGLLRLNCDTSDNSIYYSNLSVKEDVDDRQTHDWYCFECHAGGDVCLCTTCWLVYHKSCLPSNLAKNFRSESFICDMCLKDKNFQKKNFEKKLLFKIFRLLLKSLMKFGEEINRLQCDSEVDERIKFITYKYLDLEGMKEKIKQTEYGSLESFVKDVYVVAHNVMLIWGNQSTVSKQVIRMLDKLQEDIALLDSCTDCFLNSKSDKKDWFCLPCRKEHKLVFAKVRGHPYWPGKVMKETDVSVEVKFFGEPHERAFVAHSNVKSVNVDKRSLNLKKTLHLDKAIAQLEKYREFCKRGIKSSLPGSEDEYDYDNDNDINAEEDEDDDADDDDKTNMKAEDEEKDYKEENDDEEEKYEEKPKKPQGTVLPFVRKRQRNSDEMDESIKKKRRTSLVGTSAIKCEPGTKMIPSGSGDNTEIKFERGDCQFSDNRTELIKQHREDIIKIKKSFEEERLKLIEEKDTAVEEMKRTCEEQFVKDKKQLMDNHKQELSKTKKKQWCYYCEEEAIYHCCWNTSYCSADCQSSHWPTHRRVCRRKR